MVSYFLRAPKVLYFSALFLATLLVSISFYYYWQSGLMNGAYVASVYEAEALLNDLKGNVDLAEISAMVDTDRARNALKEFSELEKSIKSVDAIKRATTFASLEKEINETRNALKKLVSYPPARNLLGVLDEKVTKFVELSTENKWRTLTRMGTRVHVRASNLAGLNTDKVNRIARETKQDLSIMSNVTESSILSREEKTLILVRLNSLQTELKMLSELSAEQSAFSTQFEQFKVAYNGWISQVGPEISLERMNLAQRSKYYSLSQVALIASLIILTILGMLGINSHQKRCQTKLEDHVLCAVNEGVLKGKGRFDLQGSPEFVREFNNSKTYAEKRMSLSSIFQSALPFSAVLLDQNLKVIWANPLFCEAWKVGTKDADNGSISWDYLVRYTNIGENDPVIDSLKTGNAGIFQVQVRVEHDSPKISYEMYVNPIEHSGQKRIMIFFYPLTHLEETISNQAKTLLAPITKTLEAIISGKFSSNLKGQLYKDFELAEIVDVYDKFCALDDCHRGQIQGMDKEIQRLENLVNDDHKLIGDIKSLVEDQAEASQKYLAQINNLKGSLVQVSEHVNRLTDMNEESSDLAIHSMKKFKLALSSAKVSWERLEEINKGVDLLQSDKNEIKKGRDEIIGGRDRLVQTLDHALIFQKTNEIDPLKLEQIFGKIKGEVRSIERAVALFDKIVVTMDVKLSKLVMIMGGDGGKFKAEDLGEMSKELAELDYQLEEFFALQREVATHSKNNEDNLVERIRSLYSVHKEMIERNKRIIGLLTDHSLVENLEESTVAHKKLQGEVLKIGTSTGIN